MELNYIHVSQFSFPVNIYALLTFPAWVLHDHLFHSLDVVTVTILVTRGALIMKFIALYFSQLLLYCCVLRFQIGHKKEYFELNISKE